MLNRIGHSGDIDWQIIRKVKSFPVDRCTRRVQQALQFVDRVADEAERLQYLAGAGMHVTPLGNGKKESLVRHIEPRSPNRCRTHNQPRARNAAASISNKALAGHLALSVKGRG